MFAEGLEASELREGIFLTVGDYSKNFSYASFRSLNDFFFFLQRCKQRVRSTAKNKVKIIINDVIA